MADQKLDELPALPSPIEADDLLYVVRDATDYKATLDDLPAGSGVWGAITGTLSDQTDLQTALDAKVTTNGALGTPSSGTATNLTGLPISTGVTGLGTGVAGALAVNTGSAGAVVLYNGAGGTPSSVTLTNGTGLPIATGVSGLGTGIAGALAVNTGSAGAPVLLNGALGTPSSGTATNITGLPISTGVSGLGTGVAGALAVNTGSAGAVVLFNGAAGTPSSLTLTNATGLPIAGLTDTGVKKKTIAFVIDGAGSAITTGAKKAAVRFPWAGTITKNTLLADQSGDIVIDIWKDTYANYPPDNSDSITAAAPPTISGGTKSEDSTLTGWTTSISAGDTFKVNVDSCSSITYATLIIEITLT
jgi:hypothetical protein